MSEVVRREASFSSSFCFLFFFSKDVDVNKESWRVNNEEKGILL